MQPGYKVPNRDFEEINPTYICKSCGFVLRDAMQTSCGHHYCEPCINSIFEHATQLSPALCLHEHCKTALEQQLCFADLHFRREILAIITSCFFRDAGCDWKHELRFAEDHKRGCLFKPVPCANAGCNVSVPPRELAFHQEQECPYRTVSCTFCNMPVKAIGYENHIGSCDHMYIACPNCGKENIQLHELKKHQDPNGDCPRKQCPFLEDGCGSSEKMSDDQLHNHLRESVVPHLNILLNLVKAANTQNRHQAPSAQQDASQQSLSTAEERIKGHDWALSCLYQRVTDLERLTAQDKKGSK